MKLTFVYAPVPELAPAIAFYRDTLGWAEAWREGADTMVFAPPGSEVQVMVSVDDGPAGPMYVVDSVADFLAATPGLTLVVEPQEIPDGTLAVLADPGGNPIYVLDQARASS